MINSLDRYLNILKILIDIHGRLLLMSPLEFHRLQTSA